jgi:hypothetical protein
MSIRTVPRGHRNKKGLRGAVVIGRQSRNIRMVAAAAIDMPYLPASAACAQYWSGGNRTEIGCRDR